MKHGFPRLEWTPCSEPPDGFRRVLVWHRFRPWCRFHRAVVGWWNGSEWRSYEGGDNHAPKIYQPTLWKDIEEPRP